MHTFIVIMFLLMFKCLILLKVIPHNTSSKILSLKPAFLELTQRKLKFSRSNCRKNFRPIKSGDILFLKIANFNNLYLLSIMKNCFKYIIEFGEKL